MAFFSFIPRKLAVLLLWLINLKEKLPLYVETLRMGSDELARVTALLDRGIAALNAHFDALAASKSATQNLYTVLKEIFSGALGLRKFFKNIKSNSAYTKTIGEVLGLESVTTKPDYEHMIPVIKTEVIHNQVYISFKKNNTAGIKLFSRRGTEAEFSFLATCTVSPFVDTRVPLTEDVPEKREYEAYYFRKDKVIGNKSQIAEAVVQEMVPVP